MLGIVDAGFTSGYSIGLAQALNPQNPSKPMRAAAELWHYLCYKHNDALGTQKMESREGYFYVKFEWWERITGYSRKTYSEACALLQQAGLIDYKKMYILGTHTSCNHFKLLYTTWELAPDNAHFAKPDMNPLHISGCEPTSKPYNIKENIEEEVKVLKSSTSKPVSPQNSLVSAPKEIVEDFLVGAKEQKVSVRLGKKEANPAKRCWPVAKQVLEAWGYKAPKISAILADKVKVWIDAGFSQEQIIEAGKMMKESGDEYWQKASPIQMLGQNGFMWYQTRKLEKDKPKTFEDYQREIAEAEAKKARESDTSFWEAVKKFEGEQGEK